MDTSEPEISFDENGNCNHCTAYLSNEHNLALQSDTSKKEDLNKLVERIKSSSRNSKYDCIIGVSGGVDSTYVAYLVKELGLNPLAVHLDNGWNSELAVSNIQKTLDNLGIDLYTYVIDWHEFRDIQLSFLKASVRDAEIPTDHAIISVLYQVAAKENLKYILSGANSATEGIYPVTWTYGIADLKYIKGIHSIFGSKKLKTFPSTSLSMKDYYILLKQIKTVPILDYIDFNKEKAMQIIQNELGWRYYGGKHYESIYTRFFQGYIMPVKFKIDKRRAHLSTLICSGQITKAEALEELKKEIYPAELYESDREFVLKKLKLSETDFAEIMKLPIKSYKDYPNSKNYFEFRKKVVPYLRKISLMH
ncbi:LPS biosynthesis protein WbpG [Pontibacter akesuensis]|nr:LPS biosynthesis protein WbpG [Pontibacter akesuensis]